MACDYVTLGVQFLGELEELLHKIGAKIILLLAFAPLLIDHRSVARAAQICDPQFSFIDQLHGVPYRLCIQFCSRIEIALQSVLPRR